MSGQGIGNLLDSDRCRDLVDREPGLDPLLFSQDPQNTGLAALSPRLHDETFSPAPVATQSALDLCLVRVNELCVGSSEDSARPSCPAYERFLISADCSRDSGIGSGSANNLVFEVFARASHGCLQPLTACPLDSEPLYQALISQGEPDLRFFDETFPGCICAVC